MGIFDFFKKKKKKPEKAKRIEKPKKKEMKKVPKVEVEKKPKVGAVQAPPKPKRRRKKFRETYRVLKEPHVSEKATDLTTKNQYIFKVFPRTNKIEIKKAVEGLYGVDVLDVRIIKVPPKKRRLGRIEGWRKGYKKAIVKIREGQKIEVLPR